MWKNQISIEIRSECEKIVFFAVSIPYLEWLETLMHINE